MRKGQNPSKDSLPAYQVKRLGVAIVSYIPILAGYFEQSLEVLKFEIASVHHATGVEFDLYIFDNGSCSEVKEVLYRMNLEGRIDFLFSSKHNLGKIGALNWILSAVPNELICYADSDVLFRPGWFEHSLAIMEAFPNVGLVSAQPCLDDVLRGKGKAEKAFDNDPSYGVDVRSAAPQHVEEFAAGVGYDLEQIAALRKNKYKYVTHLKSGVEAVVGATHCQFLIPRQVARQVVPLPATMSLSRKEDFNFDQTVDRLGYYHLSTLEPYYYHMGNRLDSTAQSEGARMGLKQILQAPFEKEKTASRRSIRWMRKLSRLPLLRSLTYRAYKLLFELYS